MYVANGNTSQILQITPGGAVSFFATAGTFGLTGLAADSSGNLYASDIYADKIDKITPGGSVSLFATLPFNSGAYGLAFDGGGNLYTADFASAKISKISPDGLTVTPFATGTSAPHFIAFAPVPEPSSAGLLGAVAGSLILRRRRAKA